MRKIIISALLAGILLTSAGCNVAEPSDNVELVPEVSVESIAPEAPPVEVVPEDSQPAESQPAESPQVTSSSTDAGQQLGEAEKDVYDGIEIDAFVRERKAILPGSAIPVTVTIKNTGDKTVDYIIGSGSYTIPEALVVNVDGLQTVRPLDYLGPATMDFRTDALEPGDTLEYVIYVMAIEPSDKFDAYTIEVYDNGDYIADKSWDDLKKEYPDLAAAKSGSYEGKAYFLYYTRNESDVSDFTKMPDGYAERNFTLSVS